MWTDESLRIAHDTGALKKSEADFHIGRKPTQQGPARARAVAGILGIKQLGSKQINYGAIHQREASSGDGRAVLASG